VGKGKTVSGERGRVAVQLSSEDRAALRGEAARRLAAGEVVRFNLSDIVAEAIGVWRRSRFAAAGER
jgi:hypothetical protein